MDPLPQIPETFLAKAARRFMAEHHPPRLAHGQQVARLALGLWDGLSLGLDPAESFREELACAGILHDIGRGEGEHGHHVRGARLVGNMLLAAIRPRRTRIAGLVRFHRGPLPERQAAFLKTWTWEEQLSFRFALACLRLGDALDRSHRNIVGGLALRLQSDLVLIQAAGHPGADREMAAAPRRLEAFTALLGIPVQVDFFPIHPPYVLRRAA